MSRKWWAALVVAVVVASAFGAGYKVGSDDSMHEAIYTADCYTGAATVASCQVGDVTYGFRSAVNWTDSGDVGHSDSWPDCLPPLQEVKGVRFAAAWLPIGD